MPLGTIRPRLPDDIDRIALDLYANVMDGAGLLPALRDVARGIGASSHAVHSMQYRDGVPVHCVSTGEGGVTQEAIAEYARRWIHQDPWAKAAAALPCGVHDMDRHVPPEMHERSRIWNEWRRPRGGGFHLLAVPLRREGNQTSGVFFHRRRDLGPFAGHARGLLEALYPHLERVFAAEARLAAARATPGGVLGHGLDALPDGIALLDAQRHLVFANRAIRRMAEQEDGFTLVPAGIELPAAATRHALDRAVTAALAAASGRVGLLPTAGSLALPRSSGRAPWLVRALPLVGDGAGALVPQFRGAMLMVTDAAQRAAPGAALLGRLFGLTPAQASLAAALVAGRSLEDHARRRGVSKETVRSHLAEIRRKTGCRRQAELALLFSRLPS